MFGLRQEKRDVEPTFTIRKLMDSIIQEQEVNIAERITKLDRLAAECINYSEQIPPPLTHTFGKGWYVRHCYLAKGEIAITKIHNTNHPYAVMYGKVSVSVDGESWTLIEAPYFGITNPGTQRILICHSDTLWITFHPNPGDERDLDKIEERDMRKYEVPKELLNAAGITQIE